MDLVLLRRPTAPLIVDMRERWNIQPETRMPPPYQGGPHPPPSIGPQPEEEFGTEEYDAWHAEYQEWRNDLTALYRAVVPEEARDSEYLVSGWGVFLSRCVLFDPPETQLVEFADALSWRYSNVILPDGYEVNALPIVWRADHNRTEETWIEFFNGVVEALCEKYAHPQGVSSEEAWRRVREENSDLFDRWRQGLYDNRSRPFIDVRPYTTQEDVESAYKVLRDRQGAGPGVGRDEREELIAVQCAILHDRFNLPDPTDGRRRIWSFGRLAQKFELRSPRAAKAYVERGRELLDEYRGQ